jgi:hypothetical protein
MCKQIPYVPITADLIMRVVLMVFTGEVAQAQRCWNTPTTNADRIPPTDLRMVERSSQVPLDNSRRTTRISTLDASALHFRDQHLARVW